MFLYPILTIIFAYCSIVYQLYIAQSLTSTLGGTNFRYALTIGLYITSMGIAALFSRRFSKGEPSRALELLMFVELALIVSGLVCAPYVLFIEKLRVLSLDLFGGGVLAEAIATLAGTLSHAPILVVGLLSGLELPYLMECSANRKEAHGLGEQNRFQSDILAFDYLGTVLGALLFPFLLFPVLGIFGVSFLTASLNCFSLFVLIFIAGGHCRFRTWVLAMNVVLLLFSLVLFLNRDRLHGMILGWLYF